MGRFDRVQDTRPGRQIKASNRITAQNLSNMAKRLGRCGDINPLSGHVCVTQPHEADVMHLAMFIGGARDGEVIAEWGGTIRNSGIIPTLAVPKE